MKQKGFTLIELLAVIVVLAIIALIAVPIIMGIVEKSTKGSVKASAYGYIDAVEKSVMKKMIETNSGSYSGTYLINGDKLVRINPDDEFTFDIIINGSKDISGELVIGSKGRIDSATLYQKGYEANYDGKIVTIGDLGEIQVQKIMFPTDNILIGMGESKNLGLEIYPAAATNKKITYTISDESIATIDENGVLTAINGGNVTINAKSNNGQMDQVNVTIGYATNSTINANSIYDLLQDDGIIEDGDYTISLSNNAVIDIEMHLINENTTYETNPTLCDNVLDTKMCIYKYTGDLTINADVTVKPQVRKKGFVMYVEGTLTNNGTISMTARGAKAAGQNVQLYKNENDTFELVPSVGGTGGASLVGCGNKGSLSPKHGRTGTNGLNRGTGGGGSGSVGSISAIYSGAGAAGTSYSGGSGGGSAYNPNNGGSSAGAGGANGGAGGNGTCRSMSSGAGNPGGTTGARGTDGTGGLLVIYSNNILNNGDISANGSNGGAGTYGGGSSGGGSINLFYKNILTNVGQIQANGGAAVGGSYKGGAGGAGTVTIGSIASGTFVAG